MNAAPSMPIDVAKYVAYVTERRKKRILYKGEFLVGWTLSVFGPWMLVLQMIKKHSDSHQTEAGSSREVADKNQYPEIIPFDHNRVVLVEIPSSPHSSYINASYIDVRNTLFMI
jgi:hypothetical protein